MQQKRILAAASCGLVAAFCSPSLRAADEGAGPLRTNTPSGFPVPRFVSLTSAETNCRTGPSLNHPVKFTFKQAGIPVLIIAETVDHWRKIRDSSGDECWVFHTRVKAQTHVIVDAPTSLFARPNEASQVRGLLERGVLARIERNERDWLLVTASGVKGWARADTLWGARIPSPF